MPWNGKDQKQEMSAEEHNISVQEMSVLIDQWVFSARDRAIMKRRFCDGVIFEQIAEEFDMSDRQIKRICYKLFDKVIKHNKTGV